MKKLVKNYLLCLSMLMMNISLVVAMSGNAADQLLKDSICKGQILGVQNALNKGANPNKIIHQSGQRPIDLAISLAGYSFVKDLSDKNIRLQILELLLQNNALINRIGNFGWTPLEGALNRNNLGVPVIKILLRYGANIYSKKTDLQGIQNGMTILDFAILVKGGEFKKLFEDYVSLLKRVLQALQDKQLEKNKGIWSKKWHGTLQDAIQGDYHLIVKRLVHEGIRVDEDDLKLAKEHGSKMSGRIILAQLCYTSHLGRIARVG